MASRSVTKGRFRRPYSISAASSSGTAAFGTPRAPPETGSTAGPAGAPDEPGGGLWVGPSSRCKSDTIVYIQVQECNAAANRHVGR